MEEPRTNEEMTEQSEASVTTEVVEEVQELDPIQALEQQLAESNEKHLRALAELDNFRKRQQKVQSDLRKYGHEAAVRELLPVLDNLERAIESADGQEDANLGQFVQGVKMIAQQFQAALQQVGVTAIESMGVAFDPELHEALQEVPNAEVPPQTIVAEMQKGYLLHDRLIRPARVVVSKQPDIEPAAS